MPKPWLRNLSRYKPDNLNRIKFLRLDKNERIINFEKNFLVYLKKKINTFNISSYPSTRSIYKLISKDLNISEKMIVVTAGSDIGLKTCIEFFTSRKSKIITLDPTFGMVEVYAKLYDLKNIKINYDKNLKLNFKKFFKYLTKDISLIILANPNSPTGTIIENNILRKIIAKCKQLKVTLVIDEAYYGFYNQSYVNEVKKNRYLIITRTFSKSFGLAGLRAGYIVAHPDIAKNLYKFKPMYEINSLSCEAIKYLYKNKSIVKKHIKELVKGKEYLKGELKKINMNYIETYGNFIHINLGKNLIRFTSILRKNKILARKGPGVSGYENYLRLSLGSVTQMKKVINLIKNL